MRRIPRAGAMVASLLILAACGSNTEQQAATGAMGGAVAGAVVGGPIGAAVGAAAGGAGGSQADRVVGEGGLLGGGSNGGQIERSDQSLAEALRARGNFTTLVGLLEEAGLQQELSGSFTLFAPTDQAFAALPQDMVRRLRENPDQLRSAVRQHVVSGQVLPASQIPEQLQAMEGDPIRVSLADGGVPVLTAGGAQGGVQADQEVAMGGGSGGARIVQGNIGFANGVVHGIDKVLLPTSLSAGAGG